MTNISRYTCLQNTKKLTTSTAQLIPHTNKLESNFKCDKCRKKIMMKGTLNRRRKVHIVKCIYCENQFQSNTNLLIHKISHEKNKF